MPSKPAAGKRTGRRERGLRQDPETLIWYVDTTVDGRRKQRSAKTTDKEEAREFRDKLSSDLWREARLGERPKVEWGRAVVAFLADAQRRNVRTLDGMADKYEFFRLPFKGRMVSQIDQAAVDAALKPLLVSRPGRAGNGASNTRPPASNATLNRYTNAVSAVLNYAAGKGWRDAPPKLHMLPEDNEVVRWLTREQAAKLLAELPTHLNRMARFALATGIRKSNVCGFEWKNIDMGRRLAWVWASDAKGKKNIQIPLNDDALAVLAEVRGEHPQFVFTYQPPGRKARKGRPAPPPPERKRIAEPAGAAWQKAKARAGVEPAFRWHDLRHTWATWHVMAGTPLHVLQKLGGWASLDMVMRYGHLADDFVGQYASNVRMPSAAVEAVAA